MYHNNGLLSLSMWRVMVFFDCLLALFVIADPVTAVVWHVTPGGTGDGTSWTSSVGVVQAAIDAATSGDEIWVAMGRYNESLILREGSILYGGFMGTETNREERNWVENETILDGKGMSKRAILIREVNNTIIDGFTITNAEGEEEGAGVYYRGVESGTLTNSQIVDNDVYLSAGVVCVESSPSINNCLISHNDNGVYIHYYSRPVLTDCTITNNSNTMNDAIGLECDYRANPILIRCLISNHYRGVSCRSESSVTMSDCKILDNNQEDIFGRFGGGVVCGDATLTNCLISGNKSSNNGGGVSCSGSMSRFMNCTITGNWSDDTGGGVVVNYASPTFINCDISNNLATYYGGGIGFYGYSNSTVANSTIRDNTAGWSGGGIYCYFGANPNLTNCLISDNWANYGGALNCSDTSSPTLTNCSLCGNSSDDMAAGVYCYYSSSPTLANCILWNWGVELFVYGPGNPQVTYSAIRDWFEGQGNISGDPLFVDPENGNYVLQPGSPCIDAGNPAQVYNDGCRPPGQGTERNDMGFTGGAGNCEGNPQPDPTPTPTLEPTVGPTAVPTEMNQDKSGNQYWEVYQ